MRKYFAGGVASVCVLAGAAVGIAQISHGVPDANLRAGSPATKLAAGWDQKTLAKGIQALENPIGNFKFYGYLDDAASQTSGLRTKTEPDQNTYIVTQSNPGGPDASYDYGRHFLVQGHEVFTGTGTAGQPNAAYLTRINLDVPLYDKHRITLLSTSTDGVAFSGNTSGLASIDGSTFDPFSGDLLFTGEAGDSVTDAGNTASAGQTAFGGVYSTKLTWNGGAVSHAPLLKIFGHAGYEGIQVDDKGNLILLEDTSGPTVSSSVKKAAGYVYRFVPADKTNLAAGGKLQALQLVDNANSPILTYASQDPLAGAVDAQLYGGTTLKARWITVHTGTADTNFDANALARAAGATPFKRPENGRFRPGSGFKQFAFTATGDTALAAGQASGAAERGAWGTVFLLDGLSGGDTGVTIKAVVPGDGERASYDSITFLDKNTILVGEDRGDALHTSLNALDSTWSFDLTKSFSATLSTAQRLIAQGRDQDSTDDVSKKEGTTGNPVVTPVPDQNDGDNEVTGLIVSNGISTQGAVYGKYDPATLDGVRAFYTGQHGANVTYELLPPGPKSGTTLLDCTIELGRVDCYPQYGSPWGFGAYKVTGHVSKATTATLTRSGLTYAKGTVDKMKTTRKLWKGLKYTLVLGAGKSAQKVTVRVG